MKFKIMGYKNELTISDDTPGIIVIENSDYFGKFVYDINTIISNRVEKDEYILTKEGDIYDISKNSCLIIDIFNINLNTSSNIKNLYSKIEEEINSDIDLKNTFQERLNKVTNELIPTFQDFNINLTYHTPATVQSYLKYIGLRMELDVFNQPLDNLYSYFDLVSQLSPELVTGMATL